MADASRAVAKTQDVSVTVETVLGIIVALKPRFASAWSEVSEKDFAQIAFHRQQLAAEIPTAANARDKIS
jgi:hypothetical protein